MTDNEAAVFPVELSVRVSFQFPLQMLIIFHVSTLVSSRLWNDPVVLRCGSTLPHTVLGSHVLANNSCLPCFAHLIIRLVFVCQK